MQSLFYMIAYRLINLLLACLLQNGYEVYLISRNILPVNDIVYLRKRVCHCT